MMQFLPKGSIQINRVSNGFIVKTKGTIEEQEDGLDGVFIFETFNSMSIFLRDYLAEKTQKETEETE